MTQIVTRFAPSPTGFLHMGGVRTALFNYLYARQNKGKLLLRIEDTDKERSKEEWTEGLIADLAWLGIHHDDIAKQSERSDIHTAHLQKLIDGGHAYVSKESPTEPERRDEVIRFKNPNKVVTLADLIRGEVSVDTTDLGDFVIARSMTEPIYHFAVVVDDMDMGVTHVVRAEEHLSNTPRQILIQEALGAPRPIYAHLPLVLASDKSKLSKRKHGETVSLSYYRERGYIPEAIVNFVALLGWNPGTEQEIFSLDELVEQFKLENVQKGGAVFNVDKLNWINREYIKQMNPSERSEQIRRFAPDTVSDDLLGKLEPIILDRISAFGDVGGLFETGEFDYVFGDPSYEPNALVWKKSTAEDTLKHLKSLQELLKGLTESDFGAERVKETVWPYAEKQGRGDVLWPLRYALTGKEKSPDPFTCAEILGKEVTLARIERAIAMLS